MHGIALRLHAGRMCREKLTTWDEDERKGGVGGKTVALLVEPTRARCKAAFINSRLGHKNSHLHSDSSSLKTKKTKLN